MQVILCFTQGMIWTLALNGWRHWNRSAKFSGQSVGARIRRWWWGVNNWKIPNAKSKLRNPQLARNVSEVSVAFLEVGHPRIASYIRKADRCCSITRENSQVLLKIDSIGWSIASMAFARWLVTNERVSASSVANDQPSHTQIRAMSSDMIRGC